MFIVLSFRLNRQLAGGLDCTVPFHVTNIILHSLTVALFTLYTNLLLQDILVAWVAGLLFATHPVHVESVASLVGRADSLTAIVALLGCIIYHYAATGSWLKRGVLLRWSL